MKFNAFDRYIRRNVYQFLCSSMKGDVTINVMPSFYCHQNEECLSFGHFELNPFCTRIHKLDNTKRITKATLFPRALITNDRLVAQELQFPHVVKCQQWLSSREQVLCSPSAVVTPGHPALPWPRPWRGRTGISPDMGKCQVI